jgi:T5SS/PEP-CTERM-associated repeat protein
MSGNPKWRLAYSALALILIIDATTTDAVFGQTFWVADGAGNWFVPGNWSAGVPTSNTNGQINNGGTARLFDPGAEALNFDIGVGSGNSGTLEILGGEATFGVIYLGLSGTGTLRARNGGSLTTLYGNIGRDSGSIGTANIDGPNSKWNIQSPFFPTSLLVGHWGTGTLTIANGGQVINSAAAHVGSEAGSDGSVTVDGAGSVWRFTSGHGKLHIGSGGVGRVSVSRGGEIDGASEIVLGRFAGGNGTLTVTGEGSNAYTSGALRVGHEGVGTLRIENRGGVTVHNDVFIGGNAATADGTVIVTGAGSEFPSNLNITPTGRPGNLSVGGLGRGSLTIENGGHVLVTGNTTIASASPAAIMVSGAGSTWTNAGSVWIDSGGGGSGSASVTAGGAVTSTGVYLSSASSNNFIVVDGTGSTWTNTGVFYISVPLVIAPGTGTLTVSNGGVVSATFGLQIGPLGTLTGDGTIIADVSNDGVVAPGTSPGALRVTGSYEQSASGKLKIEIGSPTSFDALEATGSMALGGALEVSLIGGYVPSGTRSFDILDWTGTLSGSFASLQLPTLGGSLVWNTSQLYTTGELSVTGPAGLPGDYNQNGTVDAADFVVWRKGLGTDYTHEDYDVWRSHFSQTSGSSAARYGHRGSGPGASAEPLLAGVPEPRTMSICLTAMFAMRFRRPLYPLATFAPTAHPVPQ